MKNVLAMLFLLAYASVFAQSANTTTVMNNYAAFGKGDIPAIIASFAEECTWIHPGSAAVPFAGTYEGHAGLGRFFDNVGKSIQITRFEPANFRETGSQVVNDVNIAGTVLATGKTYASVMTFTWTFDGNGKATRWEANGDLSTLEAALSAK